MCPTYIHLCSEWLHELISGIDVVFRQFRQKINLLLNTWLILLKGCKNIEICF